MKTPNFTKANDAIDRYLSDLKNEDNLPTKFNRTYHEINMARCGVVADFRGWSFGESHAVWYACLVLTGRVREVSRLETKHGLGLHGFTTERVIRRAFRIGTQTFDTVTAQMLRNFCPHHTAQYKSSRLNRRLSELAFVNRKDSD